MKRTLIDELIEKWEKTVGIELTEDQRSSLRRTAFSCIDDLISDIVMEEAADENQNRRYEEMC